MKTVYLAGTQKEVKYRKYVKQQFKHILDLIDPFEEIIKLYEIPQNIVNRDLELIQGCDFLIAYIKKVTFGTTMEIKYAHDIGKKVFIITKPKFFKDWVKSIYLFHFHFMLFLTFFGSIIISIFIISYSKKLVNIFDDFYFSIIFTMLILHKLAKNLPYTFSQNS